MYRYIRSGPGDGEAFSRLAPSWYNQPCNMKLLILSCLLGAAAAGALGGYPGAGGAAAGAGGYAAAGAESTRPQAAAERAARILALDSDVKEDSFRYNYETENGIKAEETGHEANGIEAQGGFQYTGDDGQVYSVSYAAGEGGFQAQGAHLPTPPPTPDDILKALEQNARDEAAGIIDDGTYNAAKYAGEGQAAAGQQYAQYQQRPQSQQKPYKY